MATKPDEIDLNADAAAVSVDRENEGHSPVVGVSSVAETLTESIDDQGQLLDSVVDKGRVCDSAEVISDLNIGGVDVNMSSECVEGKMGSENLDRAVNTDAGVVICDLNFSGDDVNKSSEDVLDKVINVKPENETLDSGVDASTEETLVRCENDVSTCNENEAVAARVAERASGAVKMDQNLNVAPVREELEQETNVMKNSSSFDRDTSQSLPHKASQVAERASGEVEMDQEIQDMNVGLVREDLEQGINVTMSSSSFDGDTSQSLPHKSAQVAERASGDVVMDQEMNVSLVREELEQGTNLTMNTSSFDRDTSQSSPQKSAQVAERTSGELEMDQNNVNLVREESEEGTNVSMNSSLLNQDTSKSLPHKSEATSDDLEKQTMELDTQLESIENQLVDTHVSGAGTVSDALNEFCTVNLVVDLNPCTTIDGRVSGNLNTGSVSSKHEFCVGDLVWGKVRGHPWWPGQIFDLSWASQKATKYFKKDSYLIAYFEDQTFAWNEVSKIKHFREHFPQMEKQSSLADFHYAVDHALEEVSRRVEYGLACSCIPEEALIEVNTQVIDNAGIRKELNLRKGGDSFSDAVSFDPVKLCEKIKALAQLPYPGGADRLELATVNAQLSAFYRWKGYFQMPVFHTYGWLLESDAEIPLSRKVEHCAEVTQNAAPWLKHNKQVTHGMGKLKSEDGSSHKRKHIAGDNIHPSKKEKTLMDLLTERHANMSNGKGNNKLISPSSGKKRKVVLSISDDLAVKHEKIGPGYGDVAVKHKKLDSISDVVTVKKSDMLAVEQGKSDLSIRAANKCLPIKKTFGVGSSILKVASQLNGTNSLLKVGDGTAQKTADKIKLKEKSISQKSESKKLFSVEESSPDELLSQLCLTAQDPMKGYNFSISLISLLSEFRNSICLDKQSLEEDYSDKIGKTLTRSETTETSELELMNDCYWSDRVLESTSEEQQSLENKSEVGEVLHENPSQMDIPAKLESGPKFVGESLKLEEVQLVDSFDGCHNEDPSPTALILNFTDLDSVPSKENLNKIFSRFGPLNEFETEVLKSKRAKVVFKRRADAETAFSSAGKYSIFGPSLVSYCLKYMSSAPSKASSNAPKRSRKTATSIE